MTRFSRVRKDLRSPTQRRPGGDAPTPLQRHNRPGHPRHGILCWTGAPLKPVDWGPGSRDADDDGTPLTRGKLAAAPPGMAKGMIARKLFPQFLEMYPLQAEAVTKTMLHWSNSFLLDLIAQPKLRALVGNCVLGKVESDGRHGGQDPVLDADWTQMRGGTALVTCANPGCREGIYEKKEALRCRICEQLFHPQCFVEHCAPGGDGCPGGAISGIAYAERANQTRRSTLPKGDPGRGECRHTPSRSSRASLHALKDVSPDSYSSNWATWQVGEQHV